MEARVFQLKWIPRDRFMQAVAVVDGDATVIQGPVTMVDWKKDQRYNVDGLVAALKSVPIDAYDIDFTICSDPNAYVHVVADPVSKKEYIKRFIAVTNKVPALLQWLGPAAKRIRRAKMEMDGAKNELKVIIKARFAAVEEIMRINDDVVMPIDVERAQREWEEYVALVNEYPDNYTFTLDLGFEGMIEKMKKNAEKNEEEAKLKTMRESIPEFTEFQRRAMDRVGLRSDNAVVGMFCNHYDDPKVRKLVREAVPDILDRTMTVYLVVMHKNPPKKPPSLFERWSGYIKGPGDHIELAFVEPGRQMRVFSITYASEVARFGPRTYNEAKQNCTIEWWEVPNVDERKCEAYCTAHASKDRMSMLMMAKSALPFDSDAVANFIVPYVTELREVWTGEEAAKDGATAFCASTTLDALKAGTSKLADVDSRRCTANDVLILSIRRLGAKKRPYAPNLIPAVVDDGSGSRTSTTSMMTMIRSDRWV